MTGRARLLVFAAGGLSLAAQTLLLREQLVACHGSELSTGAFLATWLLWVGLGALAARRWRGPEPEWLALLYPAGLALQLLATHHLRALSGVEAADVFPLERLLAWSLVLNAPTSGLTGFVFARLSEREGATGLYAWESLGSWLGGASLSVLVLAGAAPISVAAGWGALVSLASLTRRTAALAFPTALLWLCVAVWGGPWLLGAQSRSLLEALLPGAQLVGAAEAPSGRYAVARLPDQAVILRSGQVVASYPDTVDAAVEAALAVAQVPDGPRRVLVVGDHSEELVMALLQYPELEVDALWASPESRAVVAPFLPAEVLEAYEQPRVHLLEGDPRQAIPRLTGPYDLVIVAERDPSTTAGNRLFTVELYRQLRAVMSPSGVLATQVTAGVNYMGRELAATGGSALATLEAVFDDVVVLPGDPARFYSSPSAGVTAEPAVLAQRHEALGGDSPVPDAAFASLVDTRRQAFVEETYRRPDPAGYSLVNSDSRPQSTLLALMVQGRFAGSHWVSLLHGARATGSWLLAVPIALLLGLRAHRALAEPEGADPGPWLCWWALAAAGFSGMALGVVLLFEFQARVGTLYAWVGLLSAMLLGGVALGATVGRALVRRLDRPGGAPRALLLLLAATALTCLALPALLGLVGSGGGARWLLLGIALGCGALTGAAFPSGAALRGDGDGGTLFGADHLGAALGAAVTGVVVLPLLGTSAALALIAALQGVVGALIGLVLARARWVDADPPGPRARRVRLWQRSLRNRPGFAWPRLGYALFGITTASVLLGAVVARRTAAPKLRFDHAELASWGGTLDYAEKDKPFVHYLAQGEGHTDHVLAASLAVTDQIEGYAGPINLLVQVGGDGTYRRVEVLQSQETPAYMREVVRWLDTLAGHGVDEPLDVDVVSGATLSSRAALQTIDAVGAAVGRDVLGREVHRPQAEAGTVLSSGAWYLAVALPLSLLVLLRGSPRVRSGLLLAHLFVGGLWLNAQVSLETLAPVLMAHLPSWHTPQAWLLVFGVGGLTLAFGSAYCSVLCPFGALQEWLARLGWCGQVGKDTDRRARSVKYIVLAAALCGFGWTADRAFLSFDPLAHAFGGLPAGLPGAVCGLALAGSLFFFRFWCRFLCPLGALFSLANRVGPGRRWLPERHYRRCDLGVEARQDLDCLQCNRCVVPVEQLDAVGPVRPPALGPGPAHTPRDSLLWLAIGLCLLVGLATVVQARTAPQDNALGVVRDVNTEELQRLIESRKLSGHEAEFWEPVE